MSLTCSVTNFGGLFLSLSSSETEQVEGRGLCLSLPSSVTKLQGLCLSLSSFETKFLEQTPYIFFPTQNTWCSVCQSPSVCLSQSSSVKRFHGLCLSLSSSETKFGRLCLVLFGYKTWSGVAAALSIAVFFNDKARRALPTTVFFNDKARRALSTTVFFNDKARRALPTTVFFYLSLSSQNLGAGTV